MPKLIKRLLLILFVFLFILSISPIEFQNDTFFDIALGREYSQNGIYEIDNFSVHENLSYQTHHLIANLMIYNIHKMFSFTGLYIFEIILTCLIAVLFYQINKHFTKNKSLSYILVFLEIFMFSPFISLRAQMFSTIVFLLEILLLNKYLYVNTTKKINILILTILSLLPILLINLHSGVIFFYYIIMGVYLFNFSKINFIRIENDTELDKNKLKRILIPFVVSIPLLVLNPYGIDGITYMFKTLSNTFINNNIQEFQPFSIKGPLGLISFLFFVLHIGTLVLSDKKIKTHEILFLVGTMFMTLLTIRHFIFYVIVTVVLIPHLEYLIEKTKTWLYRGLNEKGPRAMTITVYFIVSFVVFAVGISFISNKKIEFVPETKYPVRAVEFIKENIGYDKVIFNEYSWGSYMMLNKVKVFIDSRCDLYTEEYNKGVTVADDYMKTLKCKIHYEDTVTKYNIKYFLLPKEEPLTVILIKDKNYEVVYEDDMSYIFMKK